MSKTIAEGTEKIKNARTPPQTEFVFREPIANIN